MWHVDPAETDLKAVQILNDSRVSNEVAARTTPVGELLDGAIIRGMQLENAISFENTGLRGADLSDADLGKANLSSADLREADLSGADLGSADLSGANLQKADLSGADLSYANLSGADLENADLSSADLRRTNLSGVKFVETDLADADLRNIDFSDTELVGTDLSGADFFATDLSGADLRVADMSNVNLREADLSGADLGGTDLSDANLREADLSGADLGGVDLSDADLRNTNIDDTSVNGETTCTQLYEGYGDNDFIAKSTFSIRIKYPLVDSDFDSEDWDATARAYHNLKTLFGDHGLVGKARKKHVQERRARSLEAKAAGGWVARRYLGSLPSRIFTGYGVRIVNLGFWMVILFLISTAVYVSMGVEDTLIGNISYSVLAFTVAPPKVPTKVPFILCTQFIMMVETFFGTLSIVLLGYILGNRERF
ncbi:pentapeptide repeat-containing protein [Haloarcula argentinensis DSM 12282]|nr:pentapeptide repeat-containing protein [Haloarcula argentinensis DSM 12282]